MSWQGTHIHIHTVHDYSEQVSQKDNDAQVHTGINYSFDPHVVGELMCIYGYS